MQKTDSRPAIIRKYFGGILNEQQEKICSGVSRRMHKFFYEGIAESFSDTSEIIAFCDIKRLNCESKCNFFDF